MNSIKNDNFSVLLDSNRATAITAVLDFHIIKTEEGYVVDVYDKDGVLVNTNMYWNFDFKESEY